MADDEIKRAWSNLQNSPRPDINKSIAVDVVAELDLREGCAISREMTRFLNVRVYYVLIYFLTYLLVNFIFLKNASHQPGAKLRYTVIDGVSSIAVQ